MMLIGLAGSAGAGKDTVADYLVEQYGFTKFSFSDELYREVSAAFRVPVTDLQDRKLKEVQHYALRLRHCADADFRVMLRFIASQRGVPPEDADGYMFSPRDILQLWGTEYRRHQDPDYWVKRAALWVQAWLQVTVEDGARHAGLVNTSVRFPNEQAFIHALGGSVWHIRRFASTAEAESSGVASRLSHVAEAGLQPADADSELFNCGTLDQLHTAVSLMLQSPAGQVCDEQEQVRHCKVRCTACDTTLVGLSEAAVKLHIEAYVRAGSPSGYELSIADYEICAVCGGQNFERDGEFIPGDVGPEFDQHPLTLYRGD